MTTRVDPVRPPYLRDIAERLEAMMPPGAPRFADAVSAPLPETDAGPLADVRRPGAAAC